MNTRLKEIACLSTGYQNRTKIEPDPNGSHFLVQTRDFNASKSQINIESVTQFSPTGGDSLTPLQAGDVLYAAKGSNNFGYTVENGLPQPLLAASLFFVLRIHPNIAVAPHYLAWFLNQEPAREHFIRNASTGARTPVIRREHLEELEIPVPALETQRKIVELDQLKHRQQQLYSELIEKTELLVTNACLKSIR